MPAHKHAALMAEYAEVAKTSETPWTEFEWFASGDSKWIEMKEDEGFLPQIQYRRKQWQSPHKDLILQYAQDCINHKEPWLLWEFNWGDGWIPLGKAPGWNEWKQYRRKGQS